MKSSTKVSFFKLPIILALSYWLMGLAYIIVTKIIDSKDIDLVAYIFSDVIHTLYYYISEYLLMIWVSTVALSRCNIHIMTEKNILLMIVLGLILTVITHLVSIFGVSPLLNMIFVNDDYMYYDHYLLFILCRIVSNLIYFLIIGFVSYFGILSLQDVFERDLESVAITKDNSAKLHLILFIILFCFVCFSFSMSILSYMEYYRYDYFDYDEYWIAMTGLIMYLLSIMISVVILYFSIRKIFSCSFATLQTGRLIKSTIFSTIFAFLFNGIAGCILIFIVVLLAFSRSGNSIALSILILGVIFQFVMTCVIVRAVTRRYFSITYNTSIHNESTI